MNDPKAPYIHFDEVGFSYSDLPVFQHINLSIKKNEFCLLVGPNGGGKTTLIKLLIGLLTPSQGKISIRGEPAGSFRDRIGYVPQSLYFDLQFPISLGEFVMLGALSKLPWHGIWPKEVKEKAKYLLNEVGLTSSFSSPFSRLSGGQKQRATLMRAMMCDPDILLLDEPINNLDAGSGNTFYKMIEKSYGKRTIIMITHFVGTLFEEADSVYIVNHSISKIDKKTACSHYPMGLYHFREIDQ